MATTTAPDQSQETHYTSAGTPYIPLTTRSTIPIFLTELFIDSEDAQNMTNIMAHDIVNLRMIGPPYPYKLEDANWWINNVNTGQSDMKICALRAGSPGPDGRLIGGCGQQMLDKSAFQSETWKRDGKRRDVEVGYYLDPEFWGKGIIRAAVRGAVGWSRRERGVQTARLRVAEGNVESKAVVEGMKEFVAVEDYDVFETWPESKGGARRKVYCWLWEE